MGYRNECPATRANGPSIIRHGEPAQLIGVHIEQLTIGSLIAVSHHGRAETLHRNSPTRSSIDGFQIPTGLGKILVGLANPPCDAVFHDLGHGSTLAGDDGSSARQ